MGSLPDGSAVDCKGLYLDLLKRSLTFLLWDAGDGALLELRLTRPVETLVNAARRLSRMIKPPDLSVRESGMDWPAMGLTMIGKARLDNVQYCVEDVLRNDVPGDLIEAGVWRGGVPILMRAVLKVHGVQDRVVWAADSFEGLPTPNVEKYPADRDFDLSMYRSLSVSLEEVRANFRRFRLLDDQVIFLKGWFKDTLPGAPISNLAVMRLDGDLYESTTDTLVNLYPKLSPGGYAIIDDYGSAAPCRKAVDDYRSRHEITDEIVTIDWSGAYWQKT
jgi:O-methyltransferase